MLPHCSKNEIRGHFLNELSVVFSVIKMTDVSTFFLIPFDKQDPLNHDQSSMTESDMNSKVLQYSDPLELLI